MKYTAGELAKKLGVSARTVRFYEEKKLLIPCEYSEAGYRLYNENSAERLQKIIMLRFLDLSLEQIYEAMKKDDGDIRKSLEEQELLLMEKKEHLERIIEALRKTKSAADDELWSKMRDVIEMTKDREVIIQQYLNDENLSRRITIHDYSTSTVNYYSWLLEKIELSPNMKVLDIGCGNASFWQSVAEELPEGLEIHLIDYSDGMLKSAEENFKEIQRKYPEKRLCFVVDKRDATDFSYPVDGFDRVMANHMLYYLTREERFQLYRKIKELLADEGRFTATLIGKTHFQELHDFIREYYPEIEIPSSSFEIWLENVREEIQDYFTVLQVEEHENNLLVPDERLIFNYVSSYSKHAEEVTSCDKESFLKRVQSKMNAEGCFYIHKSTGIVVCEK